MLLAEHYAVLLLPVPGYSGSLGSHIGPVGEIGLPHGRCVAIRQQYSVRGSGALPLSFHIHRRLTPQGQRSLMLQTSRLCRVTLNSSMTPVDARYTPYNIEMHCRLAEAVKGRPAASSRVLPSSIGSGLPFLRSIASWSNVGSLWHGGAAVARWRSCLRTTLSGPACLRANQGIAR